MKKPVKQENREIKHDIDDGLDLDQDMESPGHEFDLREYKFLWSDTLQNRKALFVEEMVRSFWTVTTACKKLGIWRSRHYKWMDTDPEYKRAITTIKEITVDFAEAALFWHMQEYYQPVIFFLKTRGRDRGYIEKVDFWDAERITIKFWRKRSQFIEPEDNN